MNTAKQRKNESIEQYVARQIRESDAEIASFRRNLDRALKVNDTKFGRVF